MAKYIDKSAIVAEIERIKKEECPIDTYEGRIKLFYFERFLSFLDTLEVKEEPVTEELEEASKEWLRPQLDKSYANYGEKKMMKLTRFDGYAMLDAIEFGAKLGKEQAEIKIQAQSMALAHGCPKEEPVSKDLGEYINELSKQFPEVSFAKLSRIAIRVAKLQKEQTIDKVCEWLSNVSIEDMTYRYDDFSTSEKWYEFINDFKKAMEE